MPDSGNNVDMGRLIQMIDSNPKSDANPNGLQANLNRNKSDRSYP